MFLFLFIKARAIIPDEICILFLLFVCRKMIALLFGTYPLEDCPTTYKNSLQLTDYQHKVTVVSDENQLLQLCTARTAWSESDQAVPTVHSCNSW